MPRRRKVDWAPPLIAGDIVCFDDTSFLSKGIKCCTRLPGEPPSLCHHVGIMATSKRICESLSTVKISEFDPVTTERIVTIFRPTARSHRLPEKYVIDKCLDYHGRKYGYLKIGAHLFDSFLSWIRRKDVYAARRLCFMDNYPICSWLVAFIYEEAPVWGTSNPLVFGKEPKYVTPDDIHDTCLENSGLWTMVFSNREA